MDSHRETAEQLPRDPSLVNNLEFVEKHPALQTFLQQNPGVREDLRKNPNSFMQQENRFDRQEARADQRSDITRGDRHRETAEQLRRDPSLVNNQQFVQSHPALQAYLQAHQGVREEITENPNAFMQQENRFDNRENGMGRDMDRDMGRERASFGKFLGGHSSMAEQLYKNPSLVKNQEFMASHPELQEYLKAILPRKLSRRRTRTAS